MIFYVSISNFMFLMRVALNRLSRARMYPIFLGLLFLFSAFRFEVGCDWSGYLNQWNVQEMSTLRSALSRDDPTWWAMIQGVQSLGLSYPWLNVASSAVFFAGVHVLARRQPDPLGFLILLFPILIINMPMSGIRQGAAIGIMCIAFAAFLDRRAFWFAALTLLASTIHSSAIVFLLLVPLVGGDFTKRRLLMAGLLAVPGALVLLSGDAAELALSRYVGTRIDAAGAAFRIGLLAITAGAYFLILRRKWQQGFSADYKLASVGALIMCAMVLLLPISSVIADRLGYYLIPIQVMILARIPYLLRFHKTKAFYSAAPYLGLVVVFLVWTSTSWHFTQCYVPYQTWLFGFPDAQKFVF